MNKSLIGNALLANKRYYFLLISLVPIVLWSYIIYGARALRLELAALAACIAFHVFVSVAVKYIFKKDKFIFDLSSAVTAMLLVLSLPVGVSYPVLIAGCAVAILSKELFGGLGKNPLNPALAGRAFIEIFFKEQTAVVPVFKTGAEKSAISSVLENMIPELDISDMFLGRMDGNIGEISVLLLIFSAVFLIVNRVISWHTPAAYILSAGVFSILLAPDNISYFHYMAGHMLCGGIFFAAIYFACDPVTTPHTNSGKLLFGVVCGTLTVVSRIFLSYECTYILILLLGLWTPLVDRIFKPGVFGGIKIKPVKPMQTPVTEEKT